MDLIILVLVLCVVGFLVYLLTTKIPMPPCSGDAFFGFGNFGLGICCSLFLFRGRCRAFKLVI